MQSIFGIEEYGFSQFLDVLASFQIEVCMFAAAMICFNLLHGRYLNSVRSIKATPSKRSARAVIKATPSDKPCRPDYSEMIKACGPSHNSDRARELWSEMLASQEPDRATLSSMVEALVVNNCTAEARQLVNEVWVDPTLHQQEHVQIYSMLLRGFAKADQHHEVCVLYSEMQEQSVPMNTITYNTILNSMMRIGRMQEIPEFLQVMKTEGPRAAPDIVTFATIIKGYCKNGEVEAALKLLDLMLDLQIRPDEFTYNSLLDGCAKHRRYKEALRLLDVMQEQGVPPSNYTLSIAVKVLGRMHRLGQAFAMAEEARRAYGIQPNIQVYTCLMQACFHGRRIRKALDLYNKVVEEGVATIDTKTYSVLATGCLTSGALDKAVMVLRAAHHLPDTGLLLVPEGRAQGTSAECRKEVLAALRRERPSEAESLEAELAAHATASHRRH